ncbi:MAG: hypothetical protein HYW48_00505 [Deltaproteobacteria bacterium]|nr:hypothetical protein [Deltaproteobacteria bacterium]
MTPFVEEAITEVYENRAFLVIVDDEEAYPAPLTIRRLSREPKLLATPILCTLNPAHRGEQNILSELGNVDVVLKPVTPTIFLPRLTHLIKFWQASPYYNLRVAANSLGRDPSRDDFDRLLTLLPIHETHPLLVSITALLLASKQFISQAEKLLLRAIEKDPSRPLPIISLAHIYLHHAMPAEALKLLNALSRKYDDTLFAFCDLIQANLMEGDISNILKVLMHGLKREFSIPVLPSLFASYAIAGRQDETLKKYLKPYWDLYKKMKASWLPWDKPEGPGLVQTKT